MNTSHSSAASSKHKSTVNYSTMRGGKGGDKNSNKKMVAIADIIKKAFAIKEDLNKFDRALADSVKPLTDLNEDNIYEAVIDKFAKGQEKLNDAEELKNAIDRMQV